jgi:8-oxo-dGTP pyrophosphatase MutT (NUDIX family)
VLLVTSRETRRWIIPKGWPWPDHSDSATAIGEAWEEAGITGTADPVSIGRYSYPKRKRFRTIDVEVDVYVMEVAFEHDDWPEQDQRQRVWFSPEQAAAIVDEPGLGALILTLRQRG